MTNHKKSEPSPSATGADRGAARRRDGRKGRKEAAGEGAGSGAVRRPRQAAASVNEVLAGREPGSLTLVVAEKPSVARDIARALASDGGKLKAHQGFLEGDRYVVTWAIGHLLELCEPEDYTPVYKRWRLEDLPITPDRFRLRPILRTKAQFEVVVSLLRGTAFGLVVNACDAGREGELIFRHLMEAAGSSLPVKRLWISAMTDEAIREGFASLGDGRDYERLEAAARCRSESDWLVGINATRGMTRKCGVLLSVGRVQTPTLAILAERERSIQAFVPEKYWEVEATFAVPSGATYRGLWFGPEATNGRLSDIARAEAVTARVSGQPGTVEKVESRRRNQAPPLLYDLTQLQRDMNRRFGLSASRTLNLAQDLYERFKVITYPRTDSRFLSGKVVPLLPATVRAVAGVSAGLATAAARFIEAGGRLPVTGRQVNDARVRDHHAIIPTPKASAAVKLKGDHLKVFEAVARRFLAAFYPAAVFEDTTVVTLSAAERFRSRGRVTIERGWLEVEEAGWLTAPTEVPGEGAAEVQEVLSGLVEGTAVITAAATVLEKETKPPPRYTEASLLQMMETCGKLVDDEELQEAMKDKGIGTPATRAAIIERLIEVGYLDRDRRSLIATPKGLELVAVIPTRDLVSPALTGAWEAKLRQVERGGLSREAFMTEIKAFTRRIVEDVRVLEVDGLAGRMRRTIGPCPRCGRGEIVENRKAYSCSRWNDQVDPCNFTVWKVIAGRPIRPVEAARLIGEGKTYLLQGFRSRAGRRFPAFLVLTDDGVKFAFPEKRAAGRAGQGGRSAGASAVSPADDGTAVDRAAGEGGEEGAV